MSTAQQYTYDPHWYSAALQQIAQARWKHEPLIVITGAAGVGKTTLCRQVADRRGTRTFVVLLLDPPSSGDALLRAIARELGLLSKDERVALSLTRDELQQAIRRFLDGLISLKADCLLIVDEAHRLKPEAQDGIRALLDSPTSRSSSLQVVLVGLPKDAIDKRADIAAGTAPAAQPIGPRLVTTTPATDAGDETSIDSAATDSDVSEEVLARLAAAAWSTVRTSTPAPISTSTRTTPAEPPGPVDISVGDAAPSTEMTNAALGAPIPSADSVEVVRATADEAVAPAVLAAADAATIAVEDGAQLSAVEEPRASRRAADRIGFLNGLITAAVIGACGVAWYGVAHRHDAPPRDQTQQSEPAPKPPRPEETALAAIVAEVDQAATAAERRAPASVVLPEGPGWIDEVARRAASLALAQRPDIEGLVALRAAVAARKTTDAAEARQVETLLRQLDHHLEQARKRQLALDRRRLIATPPKTR